MRSSQQRIDCTANSAVSLVIPTLTKPALAVIPVCRSADRAWRSSVPCQQCPGRSRRRCPFCPSCRQRMRSSQSARALILGSTPAFFHHAVHRQRMDFAMMAAAQRHDELIADLAAEGAALREAQMMGICRPAAANQARLFGHELDVFLVAKAARLGMGQSALVDAVGNSCLVGPRDRRSTDEDGRSANVSGDNGTSPMSAALPSLARLSWNASSTCRASSVVKLFLALRTRCRKALQ